LFLYNDISSALLILVSFILFFAKQIWNMYLFSFKQKILLMCGEYKDSFLLGFLIDYELEKKYILELKFKI